MEVGVLGIHWQRSLLKFSGGSVRSRRASHAMRNWCLAEPMGLVTTIGSRQRSFSGYYYVRTKLLGKICGGTPRGKDLGFRNPLVVLGEGDSFRSFEKMQAQR